MTSPDRDSQLCDYCGLPLVFLWQRSKDAVPHGPYYCCLGCRIASQVTAERGETGQARGTLARLGIATFFAMNVMVFTLVLWSQDIYQVSDTDTTTRLFSELLRYLSLLLTIPVLFLLGQPLVENAWATISQGRPSTDVLVVVGVLAAFGFSVVSIMRGQGHTYFEVTCMVLVFVTFGRWLEAAGRVRAGDTITQLEKLLPATILKKVSESFEEVPLAEVQTGDLLKVRAGDRCPVDGQIVEGSASWDEQILTGESLPDLKTTGATVLAGALNLDGTCVIRATSSSTEGTLSRLVKLVRQAQEQKGPSHRLADRVASWFLPVVGGIAMATLSWHGSQGHWEMGLLASFAVVLVSCPCSLGLATPLAVWTALSHAAKRQVLFTSGESIEQLASISAIRLDKTGTLTTGEPTMQQVVVIPEIDESVLLEKALSLADHSTHVFSQAISRTRPRESRGDFNHLLNVRVVAGSGVIGTEPEFGSESVLGSRL
ncbi:MAG: cation-translocating P-type ATPase, partial [Planctomycetaceae bacterium]|nr:cation-translocating P-type ATPase [Planctomycetaceae bacterium]